MLSYAAFVAGFAFAHVDKPTDDVYGLLRAFVASETILCFVEVFVNALGYTFFKDGRKHFGYRVEQGYRSVVADIFRGALFKK